MNEIWLLSDGMLKKTAIGNELYKEHCASCHGNDKRGNTDVGAPSLIDDIWLYGKTRQEIFDVIKNGRAGVMPAFDYILPDIVIKQLAIYVYHFQNIPKIRNSLSKK